MLERGSVYYPGATFEIDEFDVEYRRDDSGPLLARIYRPRGAGPFPALLDVHGGAWNTGTRESNKSMNRVIASSGMVVVAIDFRVAPAHAYPAALVDINLATRWLKSKASDFNADVTKVGALGASSGGHLAVLSAMRPTDPRYNALALAGSSDVDASLDYVIACWPVLDPFARYRYALRAGRDELARMTEAFFPDEAAMREASPNLILDRKESVSLPPVLVIYGTADSNVPREIVDHFVEAYRKSGGNAELIVFLDALHGFGNQPGSQADQALDAIKEFVGRTLAM